MRIAIDIDDCICNTLEYDFACGYLFHKKLNPQDETLYVGSHYHVPSLFGFTEKADEFFMNQKKDIMKGNLMNAKPFASEVIRQLKAEQNEIIILTSRESRFWNGDAAKYARLWLEEWNIDYDVLITDCADKGKFCAENQVELLIEDNPNYAERANRQGIPTILIYQEYNKSYSNRLNSFASCWPEVYDKTQEIKNKFKRTES